MARVIFTRALPGYHGKIEELTIEDTQMVENASGIAWQVDEKTIRCIPFAQIFDITIKE